MLRCSDLLIRLRGAWYVVQGRKHSHVCVLCILNTTKCTSSSQKILLLLVKNLHGSRKFKARKHHKEISHVTLRWPFCTNSCGSRCSGRSYKLKVRPWPTRHSQKQTNHTQKLRGVVKKSRYSNLNFNICIRLGPSGLTLPTSYTALVRIEIRRRRRSVDHPYVGPMCQQ